MVVFDGIQHRHAGRRQPLLTGPPLACSDLPQDGQRDIAADLCGFDCAGVGDQLGLHHPALGVAEGRAEVGDKAEGAEFGGLHGATLSESATVRRDPCS